MRQLSPVEKTLVFGGIGSDWAADRRNDTPAHVRSNDHELRDYGGAWSGGNSHVGNPAFSGTVVKNQPPNRWLELFGLVVDDWEKLPTAEKIRFIGAGINSTASLTSGNTGTPSYTGGSARGGR
jgi:hypothetical protein